jgi:SAM-dependent methyltransferase
MRSGSFVRALLTGAGVMLAAVAVYFLFLRGPEAPETRPGNDFDPAQFVQGRPRLDVPYVATDLEVVDAMLGLARVRPGDYVIDLGSGDGRILIAAARSNGARGFGVDIDPRRIRESNENARAAGVAGRVAFRRQDLFATPLAEADVLTLYLLPEVNLRLRARILAEMRPGTRVVSHDFDMGDWHWDQRERVDSAIIYLWTVPARAAGRWTLTANGRSWPLDIVQRYQSFTGTIGAGEHAVRVEQGRLDGDRIRFIARLGQGRQVFEGRVAGDSIVPLNPRESWRAVRGG